MIICFASRMANWLSSEMYESLVTFWQHDYNFKADNGKLWIYTLATVYKYML